MSHRAPQPSRAEAQTNHADVQSQEERLKQQLQAISLNELGPTSESQPQKKAKPSARDLLEKLDKRRLKVTQVNFTANSSPSGKGSQGEVVVATLTLDNENSLKAGNQVAVKKFLFSDNFDEEKFLRTFANELRVLDGLYHPNIIRLIGFVEDMQNRVAWLVFPWEANGNVREFLLSGKWELPERVSLIKDVACGLEYLHSRQPPIRHGDLKSLNILVNSDHRAVITDFGSARIQTETRGSGAANGSPRRQAASANYNLAQYDGSPEVTISMTNAELTLSGPSWSFRWAAPEILNEEELGLASDIWALGWIAWEIVTDNYPFPEVKTNKLITVKVITGLLPSLYDDDQLSQMGHLCYLMARCWKPEPTERPGAGECRRILRWAPSVIPRASNDGISHIRSAALLLQMGDMLRLQDKHKEALQLFEEGSAIAQASGDERTMARALFLGARCQLKLVNYNKAEEYCTQSLVIYTSIGNDSGRAQVLQRLGEIQQARRDNAQAEDFFSQALAIYVKVGDKLGQANVLHRLGESYSVQSSHAKAEDSFNQALTIYTDIAAALGQANALGGLGKCHQARCNYAEAEEFITRAVTLFTSMGYNSGRANSLLTLGEILLRQARYSEAKLFLDDAAKVSSQIDYRWAQTRSKELLAEVLAAEKASTNPPL